MALFSREGTPRQDSGRPLRGRVDLAASTQTRPGRVITPDRPAPVPTQPRPEAAPQAKPEEIIDGGQKRRRKLPLIAKAGLAVGGVIATVAGVWGLPRLLSNDEPTPQAPNADTLRPIEKFDPTATTGVITQDKIITLPQEEIDVQFPTAYGKLNKEGIDTIIHIPQPGNNLPELRFEAREDKGTLQLQLPL